MNKRRIVRLSIATLFSFAVSARGATWFWDGNDSIINSASDNSSAAAMNWLNGGNWDNGVVSGPLAFWTANDIAVFGGTFAGTQTVTLGSGIAAGGLTIGGAGSAYTISITGTGFNQLGNPSGAITINAGSTLTADAATNNAHNIASGGLTLNGGTLTSINGPAGPANDGGYGNWLLRGAVTVGGASASAISSSSLYIGGGGGAFTVNDATSSAASDLVISSVILSGSAGITKDGAGTMELTAANASANATTVNGGLLKLASTSSLSGAVTVNNGGRFRMVDTLAVTGALTANAGGNIELENSGAMTLTKAVAGAGTFVKAGAGVLTAGNDMLITTGGNVVEEGTLVVNRTAGAQISMPLTIKAGAIFRITGNQYNNFIVGGIGGPGITVENGATLEAAGTTNNANNITGLILKGGSVINTGTPEPTYGTFIPRYITVSDFASTINVPELSFNGATFPLEVNDTPDAVDLDIVGPVTNGDGGGGPGGIVKTGAGTVRFQNTVTMADAVAINAGKVVFGGVTSTGGTALSVSNATLENTAQLNASTMTFTGATGTIGGHLVGSGKISILGGSTVTATNVGLFTTAGGYEITGSTLIFNSTTASVKLSGGQTVTIGAGGTVRVQGNQYNTVTGQNWVIENGGTLSFENTAQNANNAHAVTLKGGTVAQAGNPDGGYAHLIVNGGVIVQDNPSTWSAEIGSTGMQTINVGETGADVDFLVTGRLRGNGAGAHGFTKTGPGKMRVSATSSDYGGDLVVASGILELHNPTVNSGLSVLPAGRPVTVQSGATLSISSPSYNALGYPGVTPSVITVEAGATFSADSAVGNAHNIGSLALSGGTVSAANANHDSYGNFVLNGQISHTGNTASLINAPAISLRSGFSTVDVADGTAANDLVISSAMLDHGGVSALTKTGNGTLLLSGASSYTGATTVNGGALIVNGSLSGTASVTANATLGGNGSITTPGAITVATGGKLAPGASAGTLTLDAIGGLDITGAAAGTGAFVFELAAPGASDLIVLNNGALNIGTGALEFSDFAFTDIGGLSPATYTLFDTDFAITGSLGAGVTGFIGAQIMELQISGDGTDLILAVPEPGSAVLLLGGLALLAGRRRRA